MKIQLSDHFSYKRLLRFVAPSILMLLCTSVYSIVDGFFVSNFVGKTPFAALNLVMPVLMGVGTIGFMAGTGGSAVVSMTLGEGKKKLANEYFSLIVYVTLAVSIVVALICFALAPQIALALGANGELEADCVRYSRILFLSTPAFVMQYLFQSFFIAAEKPTLSLKVNVIAGLTNAVLDYVLIVVFPLGLAGAALATMLAMYCSWLFSVAYIRRQYPELGFTLLPKRLNKAMLAAIVKIGLPLGLNGSIYSVGHILMQSLINMQGSVFIAACAVSSKVTGIANVAINSLSSAATTFSGQNLGAKNYVYLKKGGLQIPLFSGLITCIAGLLVTFFSRPLLSLFTKDPAVLDFAVRYIRIVLPFTWTFAVFNGIISFVNGMGEVRFPTIVNLLMLWAVRIPVGYLITYFIDGGYVMACLPISFAFGMLCMLSYFFSGQWKKIKEQAACQQEETVL